MGSRDWALIVRFSATFRVPPLTGSPVEAATLEAVLEAVLEEKGEYKLHREGYRGGGWVLIDYGCVVVHLFMEEARQFFGLERLWADGEEVDISALVTPD